MRLLWFIVLIGSSGLAEELNWDLVARKFLLLDEGGSQEPAKIPGFNYSPFGVLVYWDGKTSFSLCTASHVSSGRLLTAAHCLRSSPDLKYYRVIFYDRQGKKKHAAITGAIYQGDEKIDIAVLNVDRMAVEDWEVLGGDVKLFEPRTIAAAVPVTDPVVAWTFSPISSVKSVHDRYPGQLGVVFRPNHCSASRTIPHLEVYSKGTDPKERKKVYEFHFRKAGVTDERLHLFLDQCDYPVIQGNSGSLISLAGLPRKKVGVLHLFVADKDKIWADIEKGNQDKAELEYFYSGNDGRARRFAWGFGEFLIASGSALESLGNRLDEILGTNP